MRNSLKNVLANMMPQAVNIVINLILPGLIIYTFGSEINGLVTTSKTIVSYISLVGAGIAVSVTQALYKPVAENNSEEVMATIRASNQMFNKYGCIYIAIAVIVAFVYPYLISCELSNITVTLLLIVISISGASEFFAIGRCRAILYAHQKVYVCAIIQSISLVFSFIVAFILLKVKASIIVVQFAISFVYVLRGIILRLYVRKHYPQYSNFKKTEPCTKAIKNRKDAMTHQLTGLVVTGSQSIILTMCLGLEYASIFAVYNIVLAGLQAIFNNVSSALTPSLGNSIAIGNKSIVKNQYDRIEFVFLSLVSFVYSVAAIMIVPFVGVYTKNADINYIYPVFAMIFVVSSALYTAKMPSIAAINAAGHFKQTKNRALIEAALCAGLSIPLTIVLGINGVVIGTGIALGWRCIDSYFYSNKSIIYQRNSKTISRLIRLIITLSVCCVVSYFVSWNIQSYAEWCKYSLFVSVIVGVVLIIESLIFDRNAFSQSISSLWNSLKNGN